MPFCTKCGAQITVGTKFCTNCGQKLELQEQTPEPMQTVQRPSDNRPTQPINMQGSYTAPVPPVQQQPVQAAYTAPAQQFYAEQPAQAAYAAPAQQQPAYAEAPVQAPRQKKPFNKKLLFIIGGAVLAVIIALVLILVLVSKGGKGGNDEASDPNLGVYNATGAEMLGFDMNVTDLFENGFSIELKDNGKCAMIVNGAKGSGTWTLDDGVLHVSGNGIDSDGTLAGGVMVLENVLGMEVKMTFEKEGGFSSGDVGDGTALPGEGAAAEATAIQDQWNGTWYGCLYVKEATGDFSGISSGSAGYYDAYMIVQVDGEGNGQFAVYLANVEEAFATANCEAKESGLYAVDGTVAGGVDMYAYNWMFLPMPDYPDQYTMGDTIEDGDSLFEFTMFMKQWGGSWQAEIDSDFAIVPPSVGSYNTAIENGELPPVGFAPNGYEGVSAPSGNSGSSDASASPDDESSGDLALTGEMDAYNYMDEIYVSFPVDSFSIGSVNGLDAIIANNGSIEISIDVKYTEGGHDYTMQYFDGLSSEQDYTNTTMTIAGYETRCVTYCDPGRLRPYYANYHVCFKDEGYSNYGVNFYVTSAESVEACTSDIVLAILNTLTIAK